MPGSCNVDASTFADRNDLDAVAAATPAYGQPYSGTWTVPSTLAAGDYALWVEVNKEFDVNSSHNATSHPSVHGRGPGLLRPVGELRPAVGGLSRADPHRRRATPAAGVPPRSRATATGRATAAHHPARRDHHHRRFPARARGGCWRSPASAGTGRVLVSLENCTPAAADAGDGVEPSRRAWRDLTATSAIVHFSNASADGLPVSGYEIRYLAADDRR